MKLKYFEVRVVGYRTIIVKAKDVEDANKRICDHNPHLGFDWEVDEYNVQPEPLTEERLERCLAHGAQQMEVL